MKRTSLSSFDFSTSSVSVIFTIFVFIVAELVIKVLGLVHTSHFCRVECN